VKLRDRGRHLARLLTRCVTAGLLVTGLLVVLVTLTPVVGWWARVLAGTWNDPAGDVLIVPGGSLLDDGTMGQSSYWRGVYAALVIRNGHYSAVVLSGGGEGGSAASAMRSFLECSGVPAGIIRVETASRNTRENALNTKPVADHLAGVKVLLTSDYHMFRASRAFQKAGIDVSPHPIPDVLKRVGSPAARWGAFLDLTAETTAILYYYWRGWI
jgi:uncharacterized SAM-binding protein YcdF (DUF218 family)